jgi:broad specificity phosphatase PhoE
MDVYLGRHGESFANRLKIFAGQQNFKLTGKGKRQALGNRKKLEAVKPFDLVLVSDLDRAVDTSKILRHQGKRVVYTPLLRERGLGKIEGRKPQRFGLPYDVEEQDYAKDTPRLKRIGIESMYETLSRICSVIALMKRHNPKRVLVVAHGTINSYLISELLGETEKTRVHKAQRNDEIHLVKVGRTPKESVLVRNWQPGVVKAQPYLVKKAKDLGK